MKKLYILLSLVLFSGCISVTEPIKERHSDGPIMPPEVNVKFIKMADYGWYPDGNRGLGMGNGGYIYKDSETGFKYLVVMYNTGSRTMCRLWDKEDKPEAVESRPVAKEIVTQDIDITEIEKKVNNINEEISDSQEKIKELNKNLDFLTVILRAKIQSVQKEYDIHTN